MTDDFVELENIYYNNAAIIALATELASDKSFDKVAIFIDSKYSKQTQYGNTTRVMLMKLIDKANKTIETILLDERTVFYNSKKLNDIQLKQPYLVVIIDTQLSEFKDNKYHKTVIGGVSQQMIDILNPIQEKLHITVYDI